MVITDSHFFLKKGSTENLSIKIFHFYYKMMFSRCDIFCKKPYKNLGCDTVTHHITACFFKYFIGGFP